VKFLNTNVLRYGTWAYTKITALEYISELKEPSAIIEAIINSKWFIWQGEKYPEGITWNMDKKEGMTEETKKVKIHGYYDAKLLKENDFQSIKQEYLLSNLIEYVKQNLDESIKGKEYLDRVNTSVLKKMKTGAHYYKLKDLNKSKKSDFSIYSFFISFLIINQEENLVTLIEFGQD